MSSATMESPVDTKEETQTVTGSMSKAYVIVGDVVGAGVDGQGFRKGQVVAEYMFQPGTQFDRLILCIPPAIRPAMPHEVPGTVVDASDTVKPGKSLTNQLNEANATVARLMGELSNKDKEIEVLKTAKSDVYDPDKDLKMQTKFDQLKNAVIVLEKQGKDKDALIEDLRKKLNTRK